MANKAQNQVPKDSQRKKLEDDVAAFLERGGEIEQIETGRSGVSLTKPADKHIKLGTQKKE